MVYLVIISTIFIGDLFVKNYIEKNKKLWKQEKILKDKLIITKYHNQGAFLNLLEKNREILLVFSGVLLGLLSMALLLASPKKGKRLLKLGLSFMVGGASSNVYDRIHRGYVVDYFSFSFYDKIVFNISDFFIFLGSILTAIKIVLK